jgi:hypothetical protein
MGRPPLQCYGTIHQVLYCRQEITYATIPRVLVRLHTVQHEPGTRVWPGHTDAASSTHPQLPRAGQGGREGRAG